MPGNHWRKEEDRILRELYPKHGTSEFVLYCLPHRTAEAIISRAQRLGIKKRRRSKNDWKKRMGGAS